MAINQLQIPGSNINNTVDQSQWTSLANLGNVYQKAQQDQANKAAFAAFQQSGDPRALIGSGDMNLAQLGISAQNHLDTLKQQALENRRADINVGLSQAAGARAAAGEARTAADWEKTPDQFATNPDGTIRDLYAEAVAAARARLAAQTPPDNYEINPDFGKVEGAPRLRYVSGGPADPKTIEADARAKAAVKAEDVPQATLDFLADRVRMGDQTVKIGYARNPGMIAKIDSAAQQREEAGIPVSAEAKAVTENKVGLSARKAAENRLGVINTYNEFYGNNTLGAIDIAEKASSEVPRTSYPKINEALNAWRENKGDPKIVALGATINTLINDYAKFTGGGTPTDALRGEAYKMLNTAHSHEQFQAVANAMRQEVNRGKQSPGMVRDSLTETYAPRGTGGGDKATATPQSPLASGKSAVPFSDYFK